MLYKREQNPRPRLPPSAFRLPPSAFPMNASRKSNLQVTFRNLLILGSLVVSLAAFIIASTNKPLKTKLAIAEYGTQAASLLILIVFARLRFKGFFDQYAHGPTRISFRTTLFCSNLALNALAITRFVVGEAPPGAEAVMASKKLRAHAHTHTQRNLTSPGALFFVQRVISIFAATLSMIIAMQK
jgi:hypothetical protein